MLKKVEKKLEKKIQRNGKVRTFAAVLRSKMIVLQN